MNLEMEIQQGEKILSQMDELLGQIQTAWQDSISWDFIKKYSKLCDALKKEIKQLSDMEF